MMKLLVLLGILVLLHRTCAEVDGFTFGFEERYYSALEGGSFYSCIIAKSGAADGELTVTIDIGGGGSQDIVIPDGYTTSSASLCIHGDVDDNNCLDRGSTIELSITHECVDPDCDEAHVEVFDDDVIQFGLPEEPIYATEGDSVVTVCVTVSCVDGPTKRCAPILFYTEETGDIVDLQKKIVLIPSGTEDGDLVCCDIEINPDIEIADGDSEDFQVHVKSEDLNVWVDNAYVTVRVKDGDDVCDPFFDSDTPAVTGNDVLVNLYNCVEAATCTLVGDPDTEDCSGVGDNSVSFTTTRNTISTLCVDVTAPPSAVGTYYVVLRRDNDQCDSHLINHGIRHDPGEGCYYLEFEGTGGENGIITAFKCTITYDGGSQGPVDCESPFKFTVPTDTEEFYIEVQPCPADNDPAITCRRMIVRTYHFPDPFNFNSGSS